MCVVYVFMLLCCVFLDVLCDGVSRLDFMVFDLIVLFVDFICVICDILSVLGDEKMLVDVIEEVIMFFVYLEVFCYGNMIVVCIDFG